MGMHGRGSCVVGEMATAVGGTHPTGMHSRFLSTCHCCSLIFIQCRTVKVSVIYE